MSPRRNVSWRLALALAFSSMPLSVAFAQTSDEFYRGKTISIIVGVAPGGSFDLYARLAARHLGSHVPGKPQVIVKNMAGAGGLTALNYFAQVAPRDGTTLNMPPPALGLMQLLGQSGIQYDARKFNWVGRLTSISQVFYTWTNSPTRSLAELRARDTTLGGTGATADATTFANLLNDLVGTKFKIIQGYNDTGSVMLAMERGEVEGTIRPWEGMKSGRERVWMAEKQINLVTLIATQRHAELPDLPAVMELATTEEQRRMLRLFFSVADIGRSLALAADTPKERVATLRAAFASMLGDPAFQEDARRQDTPITTASGDDLAAMIETAFQSTPEEIEVARKYQH